jgi:hypothetical protein
VLLLVALQGRGVRPARSSGHVAKPCLASFPTRYDGVFWPRLAHTGKAGYVLLRI